MIPNPACEGSERPCRAGCEPHSSYGGENVQSSIKFQDEIMIFHYFYSFPFWIFFKVDNNFGRKTLRDANIRKIYWLIQS